MRRSPRVDEGAGNEKDGEGKRKKMNARNTTFPSLMALTSFALSYKVLLIPLNHMGMKTA
jgi:hypothetical protein